MSERIHWWISNSDNPASYTDIELPAGTYRFVAPEHGAFYLVSTGALIRRGPGLFTLSAASTAVRMVYGGRGMYQLLKE